MASIGTGPRVTTNKAVLHRKSEAVPMDNTALVKSIRDALLECFNHYNGKMQGCAAIQIGIERSAILVRYKKGVEPSVLFNPVVKFSVGKRGSNEGCLSETGRYVVKRPVLAVVSFNDEKGKPRTSLLMWPKTRIFFHEYDHINGVLLADHGEKVSVK